MLDEQGRVGKTVAGALSASQITTNSDQGYTTHHSEANKCGKKLFYTVYNVAEMKNLAWYYTITAM